MAKIPMGNFGNALPQAQRIQMPQSQSGQMIANAMQNVAQVTGKRAQNLEQEQERAEVSAKNVELYNNQMAEKEAKIKLDDVLTSEMSEQVTLIKNDLANGTINAQAGQERFKAWSDKRYSELQSEMPGHAQPELKNYWTSNINQQTTSFLPLQLRADSQKDIQLVDRAFDIATRQDEQKGAEYLDQYLETANLPEAEKIATRQKYFTTRNIMSIDGRINNAIEGKSTEDLTALLTDLQGDKYSYLDGQTIQQKQKEVISRISAINQHNEVLENKRVSLAGKAFNEFKSNVLTGRLQDTDYRNGVKNAVAGTEHEAEFNFYDQQSTNFQDFSRKSTAEQLSLINAQKAKMKNSGSSSAADEEKILGVYESIYADKLNTVKENPNQVVRETGIEVHQVDALELKTSPQTVVKKIVENAVNQQALKDANIKLKPISAEDLPGAKKAFDDMGVDQKLNFIGEMIGQSKGIKNGSAIWGATLGQLGGGDQSYTLAGIARMNGFKSTKGDDVATAIISGTQSLKNKQLIMPKDDVLKETFNKYVGNSASGTTANMTYAGFKAIYAHLVERDNYQHKDKDDISSSLAKAALSMATGGVYDQPVRYGNQNKWKVSKPYGMDDDVFENHLNSGYASISKSTGIPVSDLESLRLRRSDKKSAKGEVQYDLINERGNPLQSGGNYWRINIKGATK